MERSCATPGDPESWVLCVIRPWAGGQGWEVAPPGRAFRVQSWRRAARPVACGEGDLVPGAARTRPLPSTLCAKPWSFQAKRSQPSRSSRKPRQSCLLELQPGVTVSLPDPVRMFNPLYGEQTVPTSGETPGFPVGVAPRGMLHLRRRDGGSHVSASPQAGSSSSGAKLSSYASLSFCTKGT